MTDPATDKATLRRRLRQQRRALDPDAREKAAHAVAEHISALPQWTRARRVAIYLAADGELDPAPLARRCRHEGQELYLPCIQPDSSLSFALWEPSVPLRENRFGIGEPPLSARRRQAGELDLLFLPLVAWDRRGQRLGMGGGYYDRSLSETPGPLRVGLAYAFQEVAQVPAEAWDVSLDWILTDNSLQRCH